MNPLAFTFFQRCSLYLLAITLMQCNREPKQLLLLSSQDTGLSFRNDIVETQHNNILTYEYAYNGAGVAAGDVNHDGLTDLYFSANTAPNKLFLNKGAWHFEDITATSGTGGKKGWKTGVTMVDVNADGWLDIYVCYSGNAPGEGYNLPVIRNVAERANELFINNGCKPGEVPTFTERAKEYGLDAIGTFSTQAYFFDYDVDGDLDMFLLNHANMFYAAFFNTKKLRNLRHPYFGNKLYQNNNNVFTEVSEQAGIHGSGLNFGLSASISDINMDHWPDIYVTNDYEEQDFCYINNRNGTFREVSHQVFSHLSKFAMGSDIADMNNDGLQDLLVVDMLPADNHRQKLLKGPDEFDKYMLAVDSGYHHQYMRNTLHLNRGFAEDSLPRFSEIAQFAGVSNTDWSWTPFFVDLDNDGLKDIFITNGSLRDFTNLDFMKYSGSIYQEAQSKRKVIDYLKVIQQLPTTRLTNHVFHNDNGIQFTNQTEAWGMTRKSVTNGAVYADLDNDGDHDLVTNNLNDEAGVFRNNQEQIQKHHYIKIKLQGNQANTFGVGSKLWIITDTDTIFQEAFFTRGYESSVEPVITVGLGTSDTIKEVKVRWPDGKLSLLNNVAADQWITIEQEKASSSAEILNNPNKTILTDITETSGLDFRHRENKYIDFKRQRLLHYQLSRLGGKMAVADVNSDGNDDIFFCAPAGQPGELYTGNDNGTFTKSVQKTWSADADHEDLDAIFFDADRDNDPDLYVVSGGSEFPLGDKHYQDRLYLNNGNGLFEKVNNALPEETTSGSCVSATDFDKDGDIDLFVGGRHTPGMYGMLPVSHILRNDTRDGVVKFTDATHEIGKNISSAGMVTEAVWTDYNNDTWPDLIIVGEWMPVRVFRNAQGKLIEESNTHALDNTNGWWTCLSAADVDGDGDTDYLLGNAGSNFQFKPSATEPIELYAGDFNDDGTIDPVLCYYILGKSYPMASRDELLEQVNTLRKKFIKYADYADATIYDIGSEKQLKKSYQFKASTLESAWLENNKGKLTVKRLPPLAQVSCINRFLMEDFNQDGRKEILAVGNFFPYKPQAGRNDASMGHVFYFSHGNINAHPSMRSTTWITGDARDMEILHFKSGQKQVVVSRNNDKASVYLMSR